jgi:two-component system, OmpR family, alkaline phosphatase synthesis response regulator PhoP
MRKILIVTGNTESAAVLDTGLKQMGFACSTAVNADIALEMAKQENPDILLVDADGLSASSWYSLKTEQLPQIKSAVHLPVIAVMPTGILDGVDSSFDIDDFVVRPFNLSELVARIKRTLNQINIDGNQDSVRSGDLVIDAAKCEVSINGKLVVLTFKEYELLKFLMRHKGKVFTREALLNEVWGYDYYGGDRTVDVHIRRLRSKIEDADHTFIETVRNIGYKFSS